MSPRQTEGEIFDCTLCGWLHRTSQPCPKTRWKEGEKSIPASPDADPIAKWAELGKKADQAIAAGENLPVDTGRRCPECRISLLRYRNILGHEWEAYPLPGGDYETPREHAFRRHGGPEPEVVPELERPRRPGLPYPDD